MLKQICIEGSRRQAKYAVHALASVRKDDDFTSLSVLYKVSNYLIIHSQFSSAWAFQFPLEFIFLFLFLFQEMSMIAIIYLFLIWTEAC